MTRAITVFVALMLWTYHVQANPKLIGTWQNISTNKQLEILNGFSAGAGPVLFLEDGNLLATGTWTNDNGALTISAGWWGFSKVAVLGRDGRLRLQSPYEQDEVYSVTNKGADTNAVFLKADETAFTNRLTASVWAISLVPGQTALFKPTFSSDAGVVELRQQEKFEALQAWGISSEVLKIGETILIEARVSNRYLVGVDQHDSFVVFKAVAQAPSVLATDVQDEREKFFDELLTGQWVSKDYGMVQTSKFRPVFGELSGVQFILLDQTLAGTDTWEFSPSTGALKFGDYGTEYIGAMVVNDTLAFVDKDGQQVFYQRVSKKETKRFTLGDVKQTPLNEHSLEKVSNMLAPQLYAPAPDNLHLFEFNPDKRTGYFHSWSSTPFTIAGETLESDALYSSNVLYQIEDFIVMSGGNVFQLNGRQSRLRPKSDDEAFEDAAKQADLISKANERNLIIRLTTSKGKIIELPLPANSFGDIVNISILSD